MKSPPPAHWHCGCPPPAGQMSRRDLLQCSLAFAPSAVLCCSSPDLSSDAVKFVDNAVVIDLSKAPALRESQSAVRLVNTERGINLIIVRPERNRFAALERSCPHGGAQVAYNPHRRTVQCTSWGHSEFALDGQLLGGSAREPLKAYPVRFTGNTLEIVLEAQA